MSTDLCKRRREKVESLILLSGQFTKLLPDGLAPPRFLKISTTLFPFIHCPRSRSFARSFPIIRRQVHVQDQPSHEDTSDTHARSPNPPRSVVRYRYRSLRLVSCERPVGALSSCQRLTCRLNWRQWCVLVTESTVVPDSHATQPPSANHVSVRNDGRRRGVRGAWRC